MRASLWTIVGYGAALLLRLGGNLVLTRILSVEAFGVIALVGAVLGGLQMLSDVGIGPSIVQRRHGEDPAFLDTAWTMQVARGLALWAIACAAALPFAHAYDEPSLAAVLVVAGSGVAVAGLASTRLYTVNRKLHVGRLTALDLSAQVLGLALTVAYAWHSRSVWALVFGGLLTNALKTLFSHVVLEGRRDRLRWDRGEAVNLFRFGRWIFASTLLTFFASQADRLIFGRLVGLEALGVYNIALMIASLPTQLIGQLSTVIVFPLYSEIVNRGRPLGPHATRVRALLLCASGSILTALVAGGPDAIDLLYDERYLGAGWVVQVLAVGGWVFALESTNGAGLLALGHPRWVAAGQAAKVAAMAISIPLGFRLGGFPGAVAGYAASEVARYAVSAWATQREDLRSWPLDLALTGVGVVATLVGFALAQVASSAGYGPLVRFLSAGLGGASIWGLVFGTHARRLLRERRAASERASAAQG